MGSCLLCLHFIDCDRFHSVRIILLVIICHIVFEVSVYYLVFYLTLNWVTVADINPCYSFFLIHFLCAISLIFDPDLIIVDKSCILITDHPIMHMPL